MFLQPVSTLILVVLLLCCAASYAAVLPPDKPGMGVKVEAGKYTVRGRVVEVPAAARLSVAPVDRVVVKSEPHVLSEEHPAAYFKGTALKKTLGPVDVGIRLPYAIAPESVKVHSTPDGGTVYEEGKDYFLDHDWGGMCRLENGRISREATVYVDYEVYLQRVDVVQVTSLGLVQVKTGKPAPVNNEIPNPDPGCTALATIYVPYRTTAITANNIYPLPAKDLTWQDFIRVEGRGYLSNTLGMLRDGKPTTVVCWGDSVTDGGSPSSHDKCYVELFRARLKAAYPNTEINLINAGIGGSNTNSRRDGYDKEVLAYNPDLITVEFVNDAGMSPEMIASNYKEFIDRARAKNPKVEFIILTPHYILPQWMGNFGVFLPALRKATADNRVALGDTANIWAHLRDLGIPYETLEANGINHPNDLGHEFFAATLMELMRPR